MCRRSVQDDATNRRLAGQDAAAQSSGHDHGVRGRRCVFTGGLDLRARLW